MTKPGASYFGDSVFLAVLREGCRPRAVCRQLRYDLSSCVGGHSASGQEKGSASGERRRSTATGRIGSNAAAISCLTRVTRRLMVVIEERIVRICAVLMNMGMTFVMASLSNHSQGSKTDNRKLAEHFQRFRPLAMKMAYNAIV